MISISNQCKIKNIQLRIKEDIRNSLFWNSMDVKDNIDEEVNKRFDYEMQKRGPKCCFNNKEKVGVLSISTYLKKIKSQSNECVLLIAIKDDKIFDYLIFKGSQREISVEDYFLNGALEKIEYWHQINCKIYNFHNHPNSISARPTNTDIFSLSADYQTEVEVFQKWKECEEKYSIQLPINFQYDDWGVVTEIDFFLYSKNKSIIDKLIKEENENDKC